jgi:hypothetical protein
VGLGLLGTGLGVWGLPTRTDDLDHLRWISDGGKHTRQDGLSKRGHYQAYSFREASHRNAAHGLDALAHNRNAPRLEHLQHMI